MQKRAWRGAIQDRAEQFALKRQVVLRMAARVFSRRGFHQAKLSDIADELHIAKPTLYHYFRSKDQILLEIQQVAISQITEAEVEPAVAGASGRTQLEHFVRRYIEMIVDDFGTCLIMTGVLPLLPENQKLVRKGSKDIELMVRDIIRRGVADGSLAPCDPKIAVMFMFGILNWIPYWYRREGAIDVPGLAARAIEFFERGMLPRPA